MLQTGLVLIAVALVLVVLGLLVKKFIRIAVSAALIIGEIGAVFLADALTNGAR